MARYQSKAGRVYVAPAPLVEEILEEYKRIYNKTISHSMVKKVLYGEDIKFGHSTANAIRRIASIIRKRLGVEKPENAAA